MICALVFRACPALGITCDVYAFFEHFNFVLRAWDDDDVQFNENVFYVGF